MKKVLSVLLALNIGLSLIACGQSKQHSVTEAAGAATEIEEIQEPAEASSEAPEITPVYTTEEDVPAEAEAEEEKFFEADGYKIYYEVVPQDKVEMVVGGLAQYVSTDEIDLEKNRLFYIHYTSAEQNSEEVRLGTVFYSISWEAITFTVDGVDYKQPSMLMNSGTQTFITYLFVPTETPDDAPVSLIYQK